MHAYIAGPMFNEGEDWWLGKIDKRIRKAGLTSYLNTRDAMRSPRFAASSETRR